MADRFPIILNTSANQLQEIASGDTLDVSGAAVKANLVDSLSVVGTGVSVAGIVTATSFVGSGANLSGIDISAVKDSGGNVKIQAEASGAIYTGIHTFGSTTSFTNGVFNGTVTSTGAVVNGDSDLNGDIDVEGDLDVDGHTNLDNVSIAGVTTFTGNADFSSRIQITSTTPYIDFIDNNNNPDYRLVNANGTFGIYDIGSNLYRMLINTNGHIDFKTNVDCEAGLDVTGNATVSGDIDVDGHTNLDNVSVAGFTTITQDLNVDGHTNLDNVSIAGVTTFSGAITGTSANLSGNITANRFTGTDGNAITLGDSKKIVLGTGSDLQIFHDGTNSRIENDATNLFIQSNLINLTNAAGTEVLINANANGDVKLYYNGSSKLATTNTGINVTGNVVGDGLTVDGDSDLNGDLDVDGHTNLDNLSVAGVSTFSGDVTIAVGTGGIFTLQGSGPSIELVDANANDDFRIHVNHGIFQIEDATNGNADRFKIDSSGVVTIPGNTDFGAGIDVTGNATITGNLSVGGVLTYEDVKNVDSVGIATARVGLKVLAGGANVVGVVTASNGIFVPDNQAIHLGNVSGGGDLQLTHNGSHSYIKDSGTGSLFIQGSQVALQSTSGENMVTAVADGAVQLMYDHSTKLATTNTGVSITGNIAVSGTVDGVDIASFKTSFDNLSTDLVNDTSPQLGGALDLNGQIISVGDGGPNTNQEHIRFGNDGDLRIYHDGSHSYINDTGTGRLILLTSYLNVLNAANNENIIEGVQDGAVNLYYNGSKKFETRTDGVEVTGVVVNDGIRTGDLEYIMAGNSGDIAIYHDSNGSINGTAGSSYIKCQGVHDNILNIFTSSTTGKINLKSNNNAETMLSATGNGAVELYYDNGKKLETTSSGITVTGNATATTFIGALTGTASGNPTLTNGSNDRIVTASGANALNGESNLTYNGNNLQFNTTANGHAVILKSTGNYYTKLQFDSNRSAANDVLTIIDFKWDGDTVADILAVAGSDSSNKDDGQLKFRTSPAQGSITERVRIEQNGQIGIGGISPRTINSHAPQVQISGNNYSNATVSIINNANDSAGAYLFLSKQRSGSAGGSTIIQSNDIIGQIRFSGADGTDLENPMAYIECRADGTPGSNDVPGRLVFYTTPDGSGSPQVRMTIKNNGRVGINESDPSEMLYVAGNIYATGNVTAYSDIRVKENVKEISNALEAVDKIRGVSYTRKDTKEDTLGVSAQEVETMFPELVVEDNHGMKSVNYNGLVGVLFSAVKELSTKLKEIENK